MLLTLSTTMPQAADLGYLLHKHPDKAQTFDTAAGTAHVFWPRADAERATVALLLEVDPVALVRGKGGRDSGFSLAQYVNDRPYAASSLLSVALSKVFRTAMTGRCDSRPDLAASPIPLEVHVPALPSRGGGADLVERLFAPLGWTVATRRIPLDPDVPAWGDSHYVEATLTGELRVAEALSHLYVLMPVLDDSKHYWVSADEIEKLTRSAGTWLPAHPERDLITRRYLSHKRALVQTAIGRLAEVDDAEPEELDNAVPAEAPDEAEKPTPLAQVRLGAVAAALRSEAVRSVVDLGCGEGALLRQLIEDPTFVEILGVDVSHRALQIAARRLNFDRMPDSKRARIELLQSSATYRDDRLSGKGAVVLMEVIEHLDEPRLPALVRSVFVHARPTSVVVTTPNVEHNVRYEFLAAGAMRHRDHRFEWTRAQFRAWADAVADAHGYDVRYLPVGEDDPEVGPPTQMAIFRRSS